MKLNEWTETVTVKVCEFPSGSITIVIVPTPCGLVVDSTVDIGQDGKPFPTLQDAMDYADDLIDAFTSSGDEP